MADPVTLDAFLAGRIDPHAFRHADHVRMGFELIQQTPFPQAAVLFSGALKTITGRVGHPERYHETITVAFLALIAERAAGWDDFAAFAAANPDLLDKRILERWYSAERLASALARSTFILPEAAR